jgi:predicted anti-sigma-YlaC factor YlaD
MNDRPFITCRQLLEYIADYVEGALEEVDALDFERHLQFCHSCRAYLASYKETMTLTRMLATDEPATDVPEELVAAILARRR